MSSYQMEQAVEQRRIESKHLKENFVSNQSVSSFDQLFELNELKAQSQEKDMVIKKLKRRRINLLVEKWILIEDQNMTFEEIETINIELDHRVTKLIAENEHLKQTYKQLYDSIKLARIQSKEQCAKLISQVNLKSVEISDLNASKSMKKPHKPKSEDTNQEKLYLLHLDLCGPMRVASVNGKKYILVSVDDYSRFTWVKGLRSKDEAIAFIINFLKMIQVRLKLTAMALPVTRQFRVTALHEMTLATISSGLVPNPPPSTPFVPPSRTDWDILFQPLFDELFPPQNPYQVLIFQPLKSLLQLMK
ncbi:integrase, catalytic region, zinc finger, CCHC-type containing protein [Tanacetum coccineum]|uniref:Integrase, catalytic region, zinc finger, CCHC-type containing protein n=1 Tax=Tanacetum coccineum TaxID=301880 RepID=A0ABQ5ARW4_9ASTR